MARAHVIVLGNEKGGSGKSTTAMHLLVALLRDGHEVGALDLDLRQKSFFRYLENRHAYGAREGTPLKLPRMIELARSGASHRETANEEDRANLEGAIDKLSSTCAFIVIDTPGAVSALTQSAHAAADTLITPINDSMVDFDLLGRVDPATNKVKGPSVYSEMVWTSRQRRASARLGPTDWVVLRNRMAQLESRNKRKVSNVLEDLASRIGFRIVPGFSERVIFRELFLNGLTLLDLKQSGFINLTLSHIAARQEVRDMVKALKLPGVGPVR
ncbi:division plane positioning ATPase MipZ [Paralimibaculum aggregatum]|uniref:Division plane positioning ATPase MipZ n=1 Tax=Paralimibaculum aggregatum TaxID=3036245 RepID=A0ABQ6LCG9_9RHOB|nr:division plane positioning ATPase MipZ [Limibaculum sp. NKW23]GMG81078.1 division plane positioning ATPase MipZ [Limibaculum sp. NKW23]